MAAPRFLRAEHKLQGGANLLPPANEVCEDYVFTPVSNSVHRRGGACVAGGHVWQEGMYGRGACMVEGHAWAGGMCGGGHAWQGGHAWWGACVVGGHAWQGGMHGKGACLAGGVHAMHTSPWTLRETVGQCAGGTHPTGMHSC